MVKKSETFKEYLLLNDTASKELDQICRLVALSCECSSSFLAFQNEANLWVGSCFGIEKEKIAFNKGPYRDVINQKKTIVENDLLEGQGFKFFAGAPIISSEGEVLGALYVLDNEKKARELNERQISSLEGFRDLISEVLKNRFKNNEVKTLDVSIEDMLAATPSCLKIIDSKGRLLKMNPQGLQLIGEDDFSKVENKLVYDLIQPEHRDKFIKFNEWICEGNSGTLIFQIKSFTGVLRWMETYAAPITLDSGETAHIAITNEVTDRINAKFQFERLFDDYKSQLNNEKDLFALHQEILNSTEDGIFVVNHMDKKIETFNNRLLELIKLPKEFVDSKSESEFYENISDQLISPEEFLQSIEYLNSRPAEKSEDQVRLKDGRVFERSSNPLIIDQEVKGRIWFFRDITDKLGMEKMMAHASKLAAIGELAAGVGHEINNPLAIIKGYLRRLQKKQNDLPENVKDYLKKMDDASERIADIVSGLRVFARNDQEEVQKSFFVKTVFSEIENMFTELYLQESVDLRINTEGLGEDVSLSGPKGKFEQIMINLISNAKDATEGQKNRTIEITAKNTGSELSVKIQDSGTGINEEVRGKIFNPFFTTKEIGKGTGIGLGLVDRFIREDFQGDISLDDFKDGVGAVFNLTFPVSNMQDEVLDFSSEVNAQKTVTKDNSYFSEEDFENLQVLIVDDEDSIREILTEILEDVGMVVTTAIHGEDGLKKLLSDPNKYDFIISDMKMPVMDGETFLREVRKNDKISDKKFFISTGGVNVDFTSEGSELNQMIDGYFFKPFDIDEIFQVLGRSLFKKAS